VQRAHVVVVDRWQLNLTPAGKNATKSREITFNNFFGIGVDAQAALKFYHLREQKPQLSFLRLVNKLW
jgi:diacylglycerol kinase (ATP)